MPTVTKRTSTTDYEDAFRMSHILRIAESMQKWPEGLSTTINISDKGDFTGGMNFESDTVTYCIPGELVRHFDVVLVPKKNK